MQALEIYRRFKALGARGPADGVVEMFHAVLLQVLQQTRHNGFGNAWPFINHSGIDLNDGCTSRDLFPGISGIEDSAGADDRQCASGLAIDVADHLGAASSERA